MARSPTVYVLPPNTVPKVPLEVISSATWNAAMNDIAQTFNTPQPIEYGGTNATNAADARTNLGIAGAPSAAKAWAFWQNDGTILSSYNVTSVTDGGVGQHEINWDVDFTSAFYPVIPHQIWAPNGTGAGTRVMQVGSTSASSTILTCLNAGTWTATDPAFWMVTAHGTQI